MSQERGAWKNYPPGSDHIPRGNDKKYREGHTRTFRPPWCPQCERERRADVCVICGTPTNTQQEAENGVRPIPEAEANQPGNGGN